MSDALFERGGDITNMADLEEAIRRDPRGAAIAIRDTQASLRFRNGENRQMQYEIRALRDKVQLLEEELDR